MESAFVESINNCLLSKLSKEFHENDVRSEYQLRNRKINENLPLLLKLLDTDFKQQFEKTPSLLAHVLILYFELQSNGPWNTVDTRHNEHLDKLNEVFLNKQNIKLKELLQDDSFESQVIFDTCIMELHKKMTTDDFRKYPSFIEVYCMLIKNVKDYKISINPVTVLPVALLLIEDYITANKIKGLLSCTAILQCLTTENFTGGNYYEVVYSSLRKNIVEKDKEVTKALFQCFMAFLNILPSDIRKIKLDDIFSSVVDQLHSESNLYRKRDCFNFTTKIIEMHGIHCVKKKVFKHIICDNIDICSNESIYGILFRHVLECLETWIKHCWCVWKLSADHKMLSSLFKILYLCKEDNTKIIIQNLILTLVTLCAKEEQMEILESLQEPLECKNQDFLTILETIKNQINNYMSFLFRLSNSIQGVYKTLSDPLRAYFSLDKHAKKNNLKNLCHHKTST